MAREKYLAPLSFWFGGFVADAANNDLATPIGALAEPCEEFEEVEVRAAALPKTGGEIVREYLETRIVETFATVEITPRWH